MTLKQIQKDFSKINRALDNAQHWSWSLTKYGETEEERIALRTICSLIYGVQKNFNGAMITPMGRLLQRELKKGGMK